MPRSRAWILALLTAPFLSEARLAHAQDRPSDAAEEALSGPFVRGTTRRPSAQAYPVRACSVRRPACIHARAGGEAIALSALEALEHAWAIATETLALPPPEADPETRAYDVFLADRPLFPASTTLNELDVRGRVDRASAFTVLDARLRGCTLEHAVARELLRAIQLGVSPATDLGSARAETEMLAELVSPCAAEDTSVFQEHPERPFADTWIEAPVEVGMRFDDGAAMVYRFLDARFAREPGGLVRALWALSPSITEPSALRFADEPDTFEVLRASLKDAVSTGSTLGDLLEEIAVARVAYGSPRFDGSIDWPVAPRRLASPPRGVWPTGTSFVAIKTGDLARGKGLRIEAEWEAHAKMRIAVIKRDASGAHLGHLSIPMMDRATSAQMSIVDLDATSSVVLAITNTGDPEYPFDPDDEAWEPHGYMVTLASEGK